MEAKELLSFLGMIGGAVMPLFNIPLIYRIAKRKSADDDTVLTILLAFCLRSEMGMILGAFAIW